MRGKISDGNNKRETEDWIGHILRRDYLLVTITEQQQKALRNERKTLTDAAGPDEDEWIQKNLKKPTP